MPTSRKRAFQRSSDRKYGSASAKNVRSAWMMGLMGKPQPSCRGIIGARPPPRARQFSHLFLWLTQSGPHSLKHGEELAPEVVVVDLDRVTRGHVEVPVRRLDLVIHARVEVGRPL